MIRVLTGDGGFSRSGARRVRQRDVVVEDDSELDDREQDQREDRQHECKLGHRLTALVSDLNSLLHGSCHLLGGLSVRGRAPPEGGALFARGTA